MILLDPKRWLVELGIIDGERACDAERQDNGLGQGRDLGEEEVDGEAKSIQQAEESQAHTRLQHRPGWEKTRPPRRGASPRSAGPSPRTRSSIFALRRVGRPEALRISRRRGSSA